ncbi:hypothetical protein RRG08_008044 [Elysia crispata]|uniref:Uncharacterized protein n=1 Tax=Elysia crispata TaxID=231223 RepID=A0AAE1AHE0_9GAST|nr:hypothetical protein RRG08_008044 [Elysia crispata]
MIFTVRPHLSREWDVKELSSCLAVAGGIFLCSTSQNLRYRHSEVSMVITGLASDPDIDLVIFQVMDETDLNNRFYIASSRRQDAGINQPQLVSGPINQSAPISEVVIFTVDVSITVVSTRPERLNPRHYGQSSIHPGRDWHSQVKHNDKIGSGCHLCHGSISQDGQIRQSAHHSGILRNPNLAHIVPPRFPLAKYRHVRFISAAAVMEAQNK